MNTFPSYDDLAAWEDLTLVLPDHGLDDPNDVRRLDPRGLPEDIVQLDRSIADLEAKLEHLRLLRAQRMDERSLITRLPPELLSRAFELGVDESVDLLSTLSLVSRTWRELVLLTPSLWTYIILDSEWAWRIPSFLRRLRVCLQRSQASKLLVDVDFRHIDNTADVEVIMTELDPHLWRCYSFNVAVPDWNRMRTVQEHSSGLGPALEDLYVKIDSSESETQEPFSILTHACPRLGYVMLEHSPLDCIKVAMPSLRQLHLLRDHRCHTSIRIAYPFKDLMTILTSSPIKWLAIRSAIFSLDATEDAFRSCPTPRELPAMKGATFDGVDSGSISLFLESTLLPALEILSVHSGEDIHWLTRIASSPTRYPSLRLLDLRNCNFNGPALVPLVRALHQLPQITGLGIASPASGLVGTRFFDMLATGPEALGAWLLPRLQALCIQSCGDISGHEILRVVSARSAAAPEVAKILFLKIAQCYLLNPEVLERLTLAVNTVRTC